MIIDNVGIRFRGNYMLCEATVTSSSWKYCNNIVYYCDDGRWSCDYYSLSDNIKKMCRREWYKIAKNAGISRKELNISV